VWCGQDPGPPASALLKPAEILAFTAPAYAQEPPRAEEGPTERIATGIGDAFPACRGRDMREPPHEPLSGSRAPRGTRGPAFGDALRQAQANVTDSADLNAILRDYLRAFLERDLKARMERPSGAPVYGWWWEPGDSGKANDADLQAIRQARDSLK
jgi:hypothetical protein